MEFTLTITGSSTDELLPLLQNFANSKSAPAAPAADAPAPSKRKNKEAAFEINDKGEIVSGKVIDAAPEETTKTVEPEIKTEPEVTTIIVDGPTVEEIRAAVQVKSQAGKRDAIKPLLTKYGSPSVTLLDKKHYVSFMAEINAL